MRQLATDRLWVSTAQSSGRFLPDNRENAAYTRHCTRKSIFMAIMKKISRDLEVSFTQFLNSDLLNKNWNYKAGPNKWSKKEIIGHLIDSAQINLQRFVRATYTEDFKVTYEQMEWVDAQRYIQADIHELLELWRLLNKQIVRVLENYPTHRLQVRCDIGKTSVSFETVEFLAQDYVNHLNHHLNAIELE
jgi:hypothetical protein